MKRILSAVILVAATSPLMTFAASPEYNYVEAGYVSLDPDGFSSLDGFGIGGSFAINERFHVMVDYFDVSKSPLEFNLGVLALGYNHALTGETDLVGRVGFIRDEVGLTGFGSVSDNGFIVQAGVRSMISDVVELNGFITHLDSDGSDTGISVGGRYFFTRSVSLGATAEFFDDLNIFRLGVRFNF